MTDALPEGWIFDMDGTLHNVTAARHHVLNQPKNFDAFHQDATGLPPNDWVVEEARTAAAKGIRILVVTARKEMWRKETSFWMALHNVPSTGLWMRENHDHRPDFLVKADILKILRKRFNVSKAFDDNPKIIKLWQSENIKTVVVPGWQTN